VPDGGKGERRERTKERERKGRKGKKEDRKEKKERGDEKRGRKERRGEEGERRTERGRRRGEKCRRKMRDRGLNWHQKRQVGERACEGDLKEAKTSWNIKRYEKDRREIRREVHN